MLGPPVEGVEQHEVAGLPQPLDQRPLVGQLEDEPLAGRDGAGQRHRHPRLEPVVLERPLVLLLGEGERLAGQAGRVRGVGVGVGRGEQARRRQALGRVGVPADVGDLQGRADLQPDPPRRLQRLDHEGRGGAGVAVVVEGHVDLGAGRPRPRRPALPVRGVRPRRQPQGRAGRVVVVEDAGVDRETVQGSVRVLGPVVAQGLEPHPRVGHPAAVLVAVQGHFLRFVRLDEQGQPAVVLAVHLDQPVRAPGRQRPRLAPPPVVENPALGVDAPLLQQPLPAVPQQAVGAFGVAAALARGGGQRAQPFGFVVAGPQHQAVEGLVQAVFVREPLELVVLDRIGGIAAQPAVADEDRGGNRAADLRGQVQPPLVQAQLEPVQPEPAAADLPGMGDLRLAQLLVQRRGAWAFGVRLVLGGAGGRSRRKGEEGRARQQPCGGAEPERHGGQHTSPGGILQDRDGGGASIRHLVSATE